MLLFVIDCWLGLLVLIFAYFWKNYSEIYFALSHVIFALFWCERTFTVNGSCQQDKSPILMATVGFFGGFFRTSHSEKMRYPLPFAMVLSLSSTSIFDIVTSKSSSQLSENKTNQIFVFVTVFLAIVQHCSVPIARSVAASGLDSTQRKKALFLSRLSSSLAPRLSPFPRHRRAYQCWLRRVFVGDKARQLISTRCCSLEEVGFGCNSDFKRFSV